MPPFLPPLASCPRQISRSMRSDKQPHTTHDNFENKETDDARRQLLYAPDNHKQVGTPTVYCWISRSGSFSLSFTRPSSRLRPLRSFSAQKGQRFLRKRATNHRRFTTFFGSSAVFPLAYPNPPCTRTALPSTFSVQTDGETLSYSSCAFITYFTLCTTVHKGTIDRVLPPPFGRRKVNHPQQQSQS